MSQVDHHQHPQPPARDRSLVSIVVPLYNEEENVRPLYDAIISALESSEQLFEIVLVDDGSTDGTLAGLRQLAAHDPRVRVIRLRRNFGQTPAMCAGIDYARGEVIVTMDGDLQNDPADIPILLERIHGGADLVAGWRRQRQDHFLYRTFPSMVANWVVAQVSDVPIHDTGCSLKAYRSELIKRIPLYSELHRFIPAMSVLASRRIEEVEVRHYPRLRGRSKYGLSRIGKVLLDLMVVRMLLTTGWRPLHWFATGGVISLFAAGLVAIAEVWHWASAAQPDSYVLPVVAIMLVYLGFHLLFAGILAELVVAQSTPPPAPLSRKIELPAP